MKSSTRISVVAAAVVAVGCANVALRNDQPAVSSTSVNEVDAGPARAQLEALERVKALRRQYDLQLGRTDEALWAYWLSGQPNKPPQLDGSVVTSDAIELVRRARSLNPEAAPELERFEHALMGDVLAIEAAQENETVSNLEAGLSFSVDGKDYRVSELNRMLSNEKSAVKRRALWSAAIGVTPRLESALAARHKKRSEVIARLDAGTLDAYELELRQVSAESVVALSDELLRTTDAAWVSMVEHLSNETLKLPLANMARADFPKLLKPSAKVDAVFPRQRISPRAVDTLKAMGLGELPGLTLELTDNDKKSPLPLVVAPKPNDVRVCFRPLGGLRDQSALLSSVGTAIYLQHAEGGRASSSRLGDPAASQVVAALFASLVRDERWLDHIGVDPTLKPQVLAIARAHFVFELRMLAASAMARIGARDATETDSRVIAQTSMSRAYGVSVGTDEGERWRIDTDDAWRGVSRLKALLLAEQLSEVLEAKSAPWWKSKEASDVLLKWISPGTTETLERDTLSLHAALETTRNRLGVVSTLGADAGQSSLSLRMDNDR